MIERDTDSLRSEAYNKRSKLSTSPFRANSFGTRRAGKLQKNARRLWAATPKRRGTPLIYDLRFTICKARTRRAEKLQKNARRLWAATPGGRNSYYARIRYILGGIRTPDDGNVNDEFDLRFPPLSNHPRAQPHHIPSASAPQNSPRLWRAIIVRQA